jgi:hypothetical protein
MQIVLKSSCGSVYGNGLCEIKVWNILLNTFICAIEIRIPNLLNLYSIDGGLEDTL